MSQIWSALFEKVYHFDVTINLSSKMQQGCPWMQIYTFHFDHQCLPSTSGILFIFSLTWDNVYNKVQTHEYVNYELWTSWSPYKLYIWPYIETLRPLRIKEDGTSTDKWPNSRFLSLLSNYNISRFPTKARPFFWLWQYVMRLWLYTYLRFQWSHALEL